MKIQSIKRKEEKLKVYDFTVDHQHHYILDNGIVSHNSYVPTSELSGGGGLKYAASTIVMLSKKKDKEGNDVIGNIIKVKVAKSRFSKSDQVVELKLDFHKGLDRYFGLLPIAEKYGIIVKGARNYTLPDGSKVWGKDIASNPEKYFTPEVLQQIDLCCKKEYGLGELSEDELNVIASLNKTASTPATDEDQETDE